jgi:hypothetical protein
MKNILLLTDGQSKQGQLLKIALELSHQCKAKLQSLVYHQEDITGPILREIVIKQRIRLIITTKRLKACENINCPVLFFPGRIAFCYFNSLAYLTDIRYCDQGVIRFLKAFNAPIFVTHITAPGLTDMEEQYAQDLLHNYIAVSSDCPKLSLRNIRGREIADSIDAEYRSLGIKLLALVNKKHGILERLFTGRSRYYHQLPFILFPYLDWFHDPSFYLKR